MAGNANFELLSPAVSGGGTATGPEVRIGQPGQFAIKVACATWNAASVKLQVRSRDDVTWLDLDATNLNWSANSANATVRLGYNELVRALVTGTPSAPIYLNLASCAD